jgi:hypothetical protein
MNYKLYSSSQDSLSTAKPWKQFSLSVQHDMENQRNWEKLVLDVQDMN